MENKNNTESQRDHQLESNKSEDIRQRLYFVADTKRGGRHHRRRMHGRGTKESEQREAPVGSDKRLDAETLGIIGGPMAFSDNNGHRAKRDGARGGRKSLSGSELVNPESNGREQRRPESEGIERRFDAAERGEFDGVEYSESVGLQGRIIEANRGSGNGRYTLSTSGTGLTNGFWRDAEWLYCRDGKYRPTKPGIFPLVNGMPGRVALLRGAGNAIVLQVAEAWIRAYLET